jgi:hypothetical protein
MLSLGKNFGLPSGHITFRKDCWSRSRTNSWHSSKALARYCNMHRLLIICANMQAIMRTMIPRNRIISVVASVPSSRNA